MKIQIKPNAGLSDWQMIAKWHESYGIKFFKWSDLPEDTSYVAFVDDKPALAVSLILTNSKLAWIEAFVGNPDVKPEERRPVTKKLLAYLEDIAKSFGAKKLFCMSPNPLLTGYYNSLGFKKTESVEALIKEIQCQH